MNRPLHLGVVGPFGSGCTTVARDVLGSDPFGLKYFSLSEYVKQTWAKSHPGKLPRRRELQDLGNKLRETNDRAILARKVVDKAEKGAKSGDSLVFESIRNVEELGYLRQKYHDFYLIGVCSSEADRWQRVRGEQYEKFGMKYADFKADEERDQNEDSVFGQQVALCMHEADLLITNDNEPMALSATAYKNKLKDKLVKYIDIFKGKHRPPTELEWCMSLAHNTSLMSECFKRQVGAVIVDRRGTVISVGYNKNVGPLKSCLNEFGDCYRYLKIQERLEGLKFCPLCGQPVQLQSAASYTCPKCGQDISKAIIPDRAMSQCTAMHAEDMAIFNSTGRTLESCSIYTTAFPCFTCAQKIVNAGIKIVIYVESYPDLDSIALFEKLKGTPREVKAKKFEGIKTRAYERSFGAWRKTTEDAVVENRKKIR